MNNHRVAGIVGTIVAITVVAAVLVGFSFAAPASAARWNAETLDGNSTTGGRVDGDTGPYNASVAYDNQPHVFYHDSDNGNLRHGWYG